MWGRCNIIGGKCVLAKMQYLWWLMHVGVYHYFEGVNECRLDAKFVVVNACGVDALFVRVNAC